jgi:DNA-binding transcriptional MocR family regulator
VSTSTVLQAYRHLEDRRVIEARPRSGYFVAKPARPVPVPAITRPPSASVAVDVHSLAETVLAAAVDPGCVSFGAACPSGDLFPLGRVRQALSRAARRHEASLGRYPFATGNDTLRQAISRRALAMGCQLDHSQILVTNGCLESISLCLRAVTQPGDVVALESPTHFGFLQILQSLGLRAFEVPTDPRRGISLAALELALDTQPIKAVLATPTLSNPLGATMSGIDKRRLAELLETRGIPLIEDAIYNDLFGADERRRAVKSFDRSGNVMICSSFSKTVAPGIRLGWVDAGRWAPVVRTLKAVLSGGQTELLELAMADLLSQPAYEPTLRRLRNTIAQRVTRARQIIGASFPKGTSVTNPAGGFILWVELPEQVDALELFRACLDQHICIGPGPMFTATQRYRHCVRLGVGGRWGEADERALREVGRIATAMLQRVVRKAA